MNLQTIQDRIAARFDYSSTAVSSSSNEWDRRTRLINIAAEDWADARNGSWRSLLTTVSLTPVEGLTYVNLPSDYEHGRGLLAKDTTIAIGGAYFPAMEYDEIMTLPDGVYACWITGNAGAGYRLNFTVAPSSTSSFNFSYYSSQLATNVSGTSIAELTTGTDITKCKDGNYLVSWVLGELYVIDDEPKKGVLYKQESQKSLTNMVINETLGEINQSTTIPVISEYQGYEPFGGLQEE